MIVGGGILSAIFTVSGSDSIDAELLNNLTTTSRTSDYRQFSDLEIRLMYGAFAVVTFCANLIFALAPSREIPDCIEGKHNRVKRTFGQEMKLIRDIFGDKRMITLAPLFLHLGCYTSFWVCVYPTTLVFTQHLSHHIYLPAYYSIAVGIGEVVMGVIITTMSKRVKNFGLEPTMFTGFGLTTVVLGLILCSVPQWATVRHTDEPAWFIQPSAVLSTSIAFLIGMADSCINNVRNVICALALPDKRSQAFAISKFYQALSGAILMFISPYLSIAHYTSIIFCSLCVSTVCFVVIAGKTKRSESQAEEKAERRTNVVADSSVDKL
ncbi:unnamed protein product [Nippostrongylus brasiliensis]|uniref:UNC93-like protein MFSD11 (inferred by orthology to a human protein) n=1 Tax=Nippostrongylus brasiliensis TaxID=27835 RepID=A0A0N4Y2Q5_NIPBR|nr:unnamed protein product [Nippostrongylus brasiliensis]